MNSSLYETCSPIPQADHTSHIADHMLQSSPFFFKRPRALTLIFGGWLTLTAVSLRGSVDYQNSRSLADHAFVLQIAVSLLNDFALVYLLAPTPECSVLTRGTKLGILRAKLSELPSHVFQQSPGGVLGYAHCSCKQYIFALLSVFRHSEESSASYRKSFSA